MPQKYKLVALAKLTFLLFTLFGITAFFIAAYFKVTEGRMPRVLNVSSGFQGEDLVVLPYTTKSYSGYGNVFEPEIKLNVLDSSGEENDIRFLLDSGAVVSTLPITYADKLGEDISDSRRIVLRGFGNKRTFGYMGNMTIKIRDQKLEVPVVFSEGELSKRILGRNGFFDEFTVIFDHRDKVIRIAQ